MSIPAITDRRFGWQFGLGLAALSAIGLWRGWWSWLVAIFASLSLVHLLLAWLVPSALRPINRTWMALGHLLGKIIAPIVLTLMFSVLFIPIAAIMRIRGRDELKLRDRSGDSFWVQRPEPVITAGSFLRQF